MSLSSTLLPFEERDIDHYFMAVMRQYRRTLPKGKRQPLFALRNRLLCRQCELSPAQQLEVTDMLWQHRGTMLEEGYYLKEDLKELLHSRSRAEVDARYDQIASRWKACAGTPLSKIINRRQ